MATMIQTPEGFDAQVLALSSDVVLQQPFDWDPFHSANLISTQQYELLRSYDKKPFEAQQQVIERHGKEIAAVLLHLASQMNKEESLRYTLALVDKMLCSGHGRAQYFLVSSDPYQPFSRILKRSNTDSFITCKASQALSMLLVRSPSPPADIAQELLRWATDQLRKNNKDEQAVGLSCLQVLLRSTKFRLQFADEDGVNKLASILKENTMNFQILYDALFCLWLLSANDDIATRFGETTVIPKVVDIVRSVSKEKCIRMGLAILNNLLDKGDNNEQMIDCGVMRVLDNLGQRKWADEEMIADLEQLTTAIASKIEERSSWDMYKAEVLSGNLEWSPVHKNEKFWRENIMRFEDNNFQVLGVLCDLLTKSNQLTLAVACHDVGQFIHVHPHGRTILQKMGAKVHIMKLMQHQDPEIQKQALLCVQKLMVVNWEYLAR